MILLACPNRRERRGLVGPLVVDLDSLQDDEDDSSSKQDSPRTLMIRANLKKACSCSCFTSVMLNPGCCNRIQQCTLCHACCKLHPGPVCAEMNGGTSKHCTLHACNYALHEAVRCLYINCLPFQATRHVQCFVDSHQGSIGRLVMMCS